MKGWMFCMLFACMACGREFRIDGHLEDASPLEGSYAEVVVPGNIAPLNFFMPEEDAIVLSYEGSRITALCRNGAAIPRIKEWRKLLAAAKGKRIRAEHCVRTEEGWKAYRPFYLTVAEEPIDPYLVYRLIPPGYEMWHDMGIYQRNLENFDEKAILTNAETGRNCMNCHSFCMQNPDKMTFHLRAKHGGTILSEEGKTVKLDTKTDRTISALVYPYWHPGGDFIAYSVNDTKQLFHTHHRNRIEVMDLASDIVVYDVRRNEVFTSPLLFDEEAYETFPAFSPDGKKVYFCSARKRSMPDEYEQVKYSLCSIDFDAEKRTFGEKVDTLYQAERHGKSVSFPRVSPDGRFLMFTLSDYGNFSIWHQEADLWMFDLRTSECYPLEALNSESVESYHTWSSNGRWTVFSSRREDGLYTCPYVAYIDAEGVAHKPFVLPQKRGDFYKRFFYSFNVPELVKAPVSVGRYRLLQTVLQDDCLKVKARIDNK